MSANSSCSDEWLSMSDDSDEEIPVAREGAKAKVRQGARDLVLARGQNKWRQQPDAGKKTGTFSNAELQLLRQSIEQYALSNSTGSNITGLESAHDLLFRGKSQRRSAWREIAAVLPNRTVQACYYAAKRMLHKCRTGCRTGKWTHDEVERLRELVRMNGGGRPKQTKWKQIGEELDRYPEACRDKWREIKLGPALKVGLWDAAEDVNLAGLVRRHAPWLFTSALADLPDPPGAAPWARRPAAEAVDVLPTSVVDVADNGRAKCKKCKLPIEKGELRLAFETNSGNFGKLVCWHHIQCFDFFSTVDSATIDGFGKLNTADQAKVRSLLGQNALAGGAVGKDQVKNNRHETSKRRLIPWQTISAAMGSRTAPQCRQRWCVVDTK